jgi:hypothetical protein
LESQTTPVPGGRGFQAQQDDTTGYRAREEELRRRDEEVERRQRELDERERRLDAGEGKANWPFCEFETLDGSITLALFTEFEIIVLPFFPSSFVLIFRLSPSSLPHDPPRNSRPPLHAPIHHQTTLHPVVRIVGDVGDQSGRVYIIVGGWEF